MSYDTIIRFFDGALRCTYENKNTGEKCYECSNDH